MTNPKTIIQYFRDDLRISTLGYWIVTIVTENIPENKKYIRTDGSVGSKWMYFTKKEAQVAESAFHTRNILAASEIHKKTTAELVAERACPNCNNHATCNQKETQPASSCMGFVPILNIIKKHRKEMREFESGATRTSDAEKFGHPDFYKLLEEMADLHSRKNHDYAGTKDPLKNLRSCTRLNLDPFLGVLVRLQDKWSRLEEFVNSGQLMVKNESVIDTLMDNAVYSLLAIILYQEQLKKEK